MTSDQLFAVVSITLGASVIVWYFYEQIRAFKKLFDDLRICFCCFDLGNGDYEIRAYLYECLNNNLIEKKEIQ